MRLYLLPVSTRRTLLYAQRLHVTTTSTKNAGYVERGVDLAARKWAEWEKRERGWQRRVVDWGNTAFRRIPYEEWGLKLVPPLSTRRKEEEIKGKEKVELVFPGHAIPVTQAEGILRTLATERQSLHRKRLMWCFVGMPITAPFALVPIIPNLPFFYLVYRAWSHWRALAGGKHIQWLIERKLVLPSPSQELERLYKADGPAIQNDSGEKEQMLLTEGQVKSFSETLDLPALEIELERAIWQVKTSIEEQQKKTQEGTTPHRQPPETKMADQRPSADDKKIQ